jgi:hypothetical protein
VKTVSLTDVAAVIRSKNAGPYELTLDIMFKEEEDYLYIKKINFFNTERISQLYDVTADKITNIIYFDPALAVKITMIRPIVSGSFGDTDVYGAQQHAPLLAIKIPMTETLT